MPGVSSSIDSIPERYTTSAPPTQSAISPFSRSIDGILMSTDSRNSTPMDLISTSVYTFSNVLYPLPSALEQSLKIRKGSDPLGNEY